MADLVSRAELRDQIRLRTDTQNETRRFPDSEVNIYINKGIAALHRKMLRSRGQGFSEASTIVTLIGGQESYALPAALMEIVKVFTRIDGEERVIHSYEEWDTQGLVEPQPVSIYSNFAYRIVGDNISIRPVPSSSGQSVTIKYVSTAVKLTADSNTVDCVDGFDEYIVAWASKRIAIKQRDDVLIAMLDGEMGAALSDIQALSPARNAAEPPRMQDVRPQYLSWRRWGRRLPPA